MSKHIPRDIVENATEDAGIIEFEVEEGVDVVHMNLRGVGTYDHESETVLLNQEDGNYIAEVVETGTQVIQNDRYVQFQEPLRVPYMKVRITPTRT